MRRARAGDEEAYAELLIVLATTARRYVQSRAGAQVPWIDDVVQETLVAIHHARQTFDDTRPFAPWFYAIAHNRLVDVLRREARINRREVGTDHWPDVASDSGVRESAVDMAAVKRALASLPPRQRDVIEQLKLRDRSVRDVAAQLGMTIAAVKVTAHRGYRTLRRLLGGDLREE
jgi:RNA polymerase sigma-70 factor, ECF subfamily